MAVRKEAVRLELEGSFARDALMAAAAVKALQKELGDLDGTSAKQVGNDVDKIGTSANRANPSINQLTGRLAAMAKVAGTLGPALVPLGGVAVAGLGALSAQLGFATLGMTSLVVAAQGVGEAVKAVEKARLEPTVANLQAANEALRGLDPAAQAFIKRFEDFRPVLQDIRNNAAAGFFPGLTAALDDFERAAPMIGEVLGGLGRTGGNLIADAAESLAGPQWQEFMRFVSKEAPPAFEALGKSIGNVAQGMANVWMAFDPLNDKMAVSLLSAARGFNKWSAELAGSRGFENFLDYIDENGPKVAEATGAIADAVVQIVQAAAPLGGPVLEGITSFAEAVAAIADSPLGTPIMAAVTAISALSLAANLGTAAVTRLNVALAATGAAGGAKGAGRLGMIAGGPAGIAAAIGLTNIPDELGHLQSILNGETGVVEGVLRFAAAMQPAGQMAQLLGIDVLGTKKPFLEAMAASEGFGQSVATTTETVKRAAPQMYRLATAVARQKEAAGEGARAFRDLSTSMSAKNFDGEKWIRQLERQAEALKDFRRNAVLAAERGLRRGLIAELQRMGPEGAVQLEFLARTTKRNLDRVNEYWRSTHGSIKGAENDVRATGDEIQRVGRMRVNPELDVKSNAQDVVSRANQALMGINGNTAHTYIYTHLRTVRGPNDGAGGPPAPNGTFSSGGYTGRGGRFEPAGTVHRDEVVLPRDIVRRDAAMLKARYGFLPGMANLPSPRQVLAQRLAAERGAMPMRSERPMRSESRQVIEHRQVVEVHLTGNMDWSKARGEIERQVVKIAADQIEQNDGWKASQA